MNKRLLDFFNEAFKDGNNDSKAYRYVNGFIMVLILISTLEIIFSSEPAFKAYEPYLQTVFIITSCFFLTEIILRLYVKIKTDKEFKGIESYKNYFLDFYNLMDIIAVLPFFIGFFGIYLSPFWKSLRVLRIFKILRYFPSVELLINSLKNKKNILLISMQSILFLALILSIALYYSEHKVENSQFTSISSALLWSVAKFIGDIGGYGDFVPMTVAGKILATMNGILGIAIFALPAGIIGSGFVEEIEKREKEKKAIENIQLLKEVFSRDHIDGTNRNKKKYDLVNTRRKILTYNEIKFRLNLTDDEIAAIIDRKSGLRIRTMVDGNKTEKIIAEYYLDNSVYGTFLNNNSSVTIISPESGSQPYMGHFTHALATRLNANYLSVEKFSRSDFNPNKCLNFLVNEDYFTDADIAGFKKFKEDLNSINEITELYIVIGAKASKGFDVLNATNAGEDKMDTKDNSRIIEKLGLITENLGLELAEENLTAVFQSEYSNEYEHHICKFLNTKLVKDVFQINVSAGHLKINTEEYYKSIYVITENIKKFFKV